MKHPFFKKSLSLLFVSSILSACVAESNKDLDDLTTEFKSLDDYWLERVDSQKEQASKACQRPTEDRVFEALCRRENVSITGIRDLYSALGMINAQGRLGFNSKATNSSGLSFQTVSILSPRIVASSMNVRASDMEGGFVNTAYSRGEQFVEILAHDQTAQKLNFYLLRYKQACNMAGGCSLEDLLSDDTEAGWVTWTLYRAEDITDTPLDCLSCHQRPSDQKTPRMLMRDLFDPWVHWLTGYSVSCDGGEQLGKGVSELPLAERYLAFYPEGYGGIDLSDSGNGHNLQTQLSFVDQSFSGLSDMDTDIRMNSRAVFKEWLCDQKTDTWSAYRDTSLVKQGFPVQSYKPDILSGFAQQFETYADFIEYSKDKSVFQALSDAIPRETQIEQGSLIDEDIMGKQILQQACIRCHGDSAPEGSKRALFHWSNLTPQSISVAIDRISRDADDPLLMPPVRSTRLTEGAVKKLKEYLEQQSFEQ